MLSPVRVVGKKERRWRKFEGAEAKRGGNQMKTEED